MKFKVKTKQPERKLVAVVIASCIYWEENGVTYGRSGLFAKPNDTIGRSLADLAAGSQARAIYEGDILEVEF